MSTIVSKLSVCACTINTVQIRFLPDKKNSRYLKVGVCALARPEHVSAIIAKIPIIKSGQIKRFVSGVLAGGLWDVRYCSV